MYMHVDEYCCVPPSQLLEHEPTDDQAAQYGQLWVLQSFVRDRVV